MKFGLNPVSSFEHAERIEHAEKASSSPKAFEDKSDLRLRELGYVPQFERNMSFADCSQVLASKPKVN
ncbi:hypothetical protein Clacol_009746 [Clathrus columnatus]|uniref:Uncharacterized protein n=1 Tax=Clathrus columnatus TaxID=1419009 RepID=A0AAV5APN1_9AGAM|nr:hypothetical protein Clacol_009746 [Clathrus columnatus]